MYVVDSVVRVFFPVRTSRANLLSSTRFQTSENRTITHTRRTTIRPFLLLLWRQTVATIIGHYCRSLRIRVKWLIRFESEMNEIPKRKKKPCHYDIIFVMTYGTHWNIISIKNKNIYAFVGKVVVETQRSWTIHQLKKKEKIKEKKRNEKKVNGLM